jgi:hypothetical protein
MNRCPKHQTIPVNNMNADGGAAECGACIMAEVYYLFQSRLDVLDTLANLLQAHAEIRSALSDSKRQLAFYQPNAPQEES